MGWIVDATEKVDESLRLKVVEKLEAGTFGQNDLKDYFTLFILKDASGTQDQKTSLWSRLCRSCRHTCSGDR